MEFQWSGLLSFNVHNGYYEKVLIIVDEQMGIKKHEDTIINFDTNEFIVIVF